VRVHDDGFGVESFRLWCDGAAGLLRECQGECEVSYKETDRRYECCTEHRITGNAFGILRYVGRKLNGDYRVFEFRGDANVANSDSCGSWPIIAS
jgi:hypothetical protein